MSGSTVICVYAKVFSAVVELLWESGVYSVALVDKHDDSREELTASLQCCGCKVRAFAHWRQAREALNEAAVDAVVLCDWRRSGGRGAYRYLQRAAGDAPFVLVCDGGVTCWDDRFTAVLYYPVNEQNLFRAISNAIVDASASLTLGEFTLNLKRRTLSRDDLALRLTPSEVNILKVLMLAQGRFVPSKDLVAKAWGIQTLPDRRVIYTHVAWLRRKLNAVFGSARLILSVRGHGYCFDPSLAVESACARAGE